MSTWYNIRGVTVFSLVCLDFLDKGLRFLGIAWCIKECQYLRRYDSFQHMDMAALAPWENIENQGVKSPCLVYKQFFFHDRPWLEASHAEHQHSRR